MSPLADANFVRNDLSIWNDYPLPTEITPILLAGGLGTRLRSVVEDCPKVLADVAGRPFLYHLLDQLAEAKFSQVVLLTGYRSEQIEAEVGSAYRGMRIKYSQESEPLGTAGAIRLARDSITTPTVLLLNGDSFCDVPFDHFIEYHQQCRADLTMTLCWAADASRFGAVAFDDDQRMIGFGEKKTVAAGWINAGISLMSARLINEIPSGGFVSLERDLLPRWVEEKEVRGFPTNGTFIDIGTPGSFAEAQTMFGSRVGSV